MGASTSGGKGNVTTPGQGGQPAYGQPSSSGAFQRQFGQPSASMDMPQQYSSNQPSLGKQVQQNQYGNTVGGWDNASIQPQSSSGKGSGSGGSTANSGKG
jgi:hypothetical protein